MMNDDEYYDSYQQDTKSNIGRWFVFGFVLILAIIGFYGIIMYTTYETIFLSMFIYMPMGIYKLEKSNH